MAALMKATHVSSLESSSSNTLPLLAAKLAQLCNGLPLKDAVFQVLQSHPENLCRDHIGDQPASIVVAEPYYHVLEGWHLQEALLYFYLLRSLKQKGVIESSAVCIPSSASIMMCGIECEDLISAYKGCQEQICGFDHRVVNAYGDRYHTYDLSIPIWQYDHTRVTTPVRVALLDYVNGRMDSGSMQDFVFTANKTCHCMLCWVEYHAEGVDAIFSTGRLPYNQTIRLLKDPLPPSMTRKLQAKLVVGDIADNRSHDMFVQSNP